MLPLRQKTTLEFLPDFGPQQKDFDRDGGRMGILQKIAVS